MDGPQDANHVVRVVNVNVLDNPTSLTNPFQFEIIFESSRDLLDDLEWKLTYVGDHRTVEGDQVLDSVMIGPISRGTHKFCLQTNPPDVSRIPEDCLLGLTVVFLSGCYRSQEFVRVGYYVNNTCTTCWKQFSQIQRCILAEKPRMTLTPILWD
ncbi:anti-silencing factor [Blastocystis sp. ATCC 50177/Nand II]|uniref:Anti-silencing factor n=1 Tax=Blastocystis sp. subtype 1 (strain ATCC 50177 / NandII) TaxID=478820 RepID=A0A196SAI7_BLAHN|nr:anti-silencing factor 1 [Blastocystis sp. ATCC 50177/Nand II]OAO17028.1 anti-silencing factor [Blastocystis sp. ATCC 50177/Nand II]